MRKTIINEKQNYVISLYTYIYKFAYIYKNIYINIANIYINLHSLLFPFLILCKAGL